MAIAAPSKALDEREISCTVTEYSQVAAAVASCTAIAIDGITVPAGTTLDLTNVKIATMRCLIPAIFFLSSNVFQTGTIITFTGTTTFAHKNWAGPLVSVTGTGITITGTGTLDGLGGQYWDGKGSNKGGSIKPKFFAAHNMIHSRIENIKILNSPVQVFSIDGASFLNIDSVTIDNSAGAALGHNTDGFDVGSSTHVTVNNATVHNQDDCVAVNSGTNLYFSNMHCNGGHGLSIGSVGGRPDNTVKNVTFIDSQVHNSENGVRIKSVYGATGSVSDVTYSGITMNGITTYGVVIEQDYENGSPKGVATNGVPITGLTLTSVTGTVSSGAKDYYILCGSGSCSNWSFRDVSVTGGKSNSCNFKPNGFSC